MRVIVVLSMLLFVLSACAPRGIVGEEPQVSVHNLSPQEASGLLGQKAEMNLFVLNVHTPYEGEIAGTDAFIEDWENVAAHVDQLPMDKSQPLFVYCRSGMMSSSAVEQLKALGYLNIYHLKDGMRAWSAAGLPLVGESG